MASSFVGRVVDWVIALLQMTESLRSVPNGVLIEEYNSDQLVPGYLTSIVNKVSSI